MCKHHYVNVIAHLTIVREPERGFINKFFTRERERKMRVKICERERKGKLTTQEMLRGMDVEFEMEKRFSINEIQFNIKH